MSYNSFISLLDYPFSRHINTVVRGNMARQITIMNLCGVLIVANILFLFGMEQTESEVWNKTRIVGNYFFIKYSFT